MAAQDKYLLCLSQGLQWDLVAGRLGQGERQGPLLCTGVGTNQEGLQKKGRLLDDTQASARMAGGCWLRPRAWGELQVQWREGDMTLPGRLAVGSGCSGDTCW